MKNINLKSYAKINIALNINKKLDDGYHELDSVMLPLELHDSLLIKKLDSSADNYVTIDDYSLGVINYNLATSTIDRMAAEYGFEDKFRVFIHKNIPIRAGLGGGSSNAAYTMKGVNTMLKLNMTREQMISMALELGSDIPYFIDCVPSRVQGKGEIIQPIVIKNNYYCLLIKPPIGCSTKEVYEKSDTIKLGKANIDKVVEALANGDDDLLATSIYNALEEAAILILPEIKELKQKLLDSGLKIVGMSGSGSCLFALSTNFADIKKAAKLFDDEKYFVEITKIKKN